MESLEKGHQPLRREMTRTSPGSTVPLTPGSPAREKYDWREIKVKPALISSNGQLGQKKNLSRSSSLSEKELKEARDRSQIIAGQLTAPSNANSRGVQLFNRRKERVNAFTLVSFGKGLGQEAPGNEKEGSGQSTLTWEERCTGRKDRELNHRNIEPSWYSSASDYRGHKTIEESKPIVEVEKADPQMEERHFRPVHVKDEDLSAEALGDVEEKMHGSYNNRFVQSNTEKEGTEVYRPDTDSFIPPREIPNGCPQNPTNISLSQTKQTLSIINRTARPFGSPSILRSPGATSPVMDVTPPPTRPLPPFTRTHPPAFSPPPPPPPPTYSPSPLSSGCNPSPPVFSSPPPVSRIILPSPCLPQHEATAAHRPKYVPLFSGERKQVPIKTGILEEGKTRRAARKTMFTFQEKPKIAPNPELLSLVQGADEKRKLKSLPEQIQEEELLALGAEASNFLAKEIFSSEETNLPEWSSCLKSSGIRSRCEPKPEQGLTNASGKGAELFARRQSRMEKYVIETPSLGERYMRSPSPTMSLPPSWIYPSNKPSRIKATAIPSNINTKTNGTLKAPSANQENKVLVPEGSVVENGCIKKELEISKHQPYKLNSSLFILNPIKDPMSSLPKGAPPPKPMVREAYLRQASLPTNPISLSPHIKSPAPFMPNACLSPQGPQSPVNGVGSGNVKLNYGASHVAGMGHAGSPVSTLTPERVASPQTGIQAPRPTFSAKKAGIQPQIRKMPTTPWSPTQLTDSFEGVTSAIKTHSTPESQVTTTPTPLSPPWNDRCQSPPVSQDVKTNRRLLAKNIINAAKRKNSPSPGGPSGQGGSSSPAFFPQGQRPFSPSQPRSLVSASPTFISPPSTPTCKARSPLSLYATRSLTDSDASVESEDLGLRSPGIRSYNTCPRGWGGSLRFKRGSFPADL